MGYAGNQRNLIGWFRILKTKEHWLSTENQKAEWMYWCIGKLVFNYELWNLYKLFVPFCSSVLRSNASFNRSTSCHKLEFSSRSSKDSFNVRLTFSLCTYWACSSFIFNSANLKLLLCFSLNSWWLSSSSVAHFNSSSSHAWRDSAIIWSLFWDSLSALT